MEEGSLNSNHDIFYFYLPKLTALADERSVCDSVTYRSHYITVYDIYFTLATKTVEQINTEQL